MSGSSYEVFARIVRPGSSEIEAKRTRIVVDSSPGRSDELPGPAELLCGAFAACLLKNVERFSEILHFTQRGASVRVTAERGEAPPKFTQIHYELRIVTDERQRRVDLLRENLVKHGTVYNTLAEVCDVAGEVVAVPTAEVA